MLKQAVGTAFHMSLAPSAGPVLRWAGSKRRVTPLLADHAPNHFERYLEPFAGSAALFFHLQPANAVLGDANREVTATYEAIKRDPTLVSNLLDGIPHTKTAYLRMRSLLPTALTVAQRAARLIFLMKGSFNGVYRTNRLGHFNVPFGTRIYRIPTRDEIARVSKALTGVKIETGDYRNWVVDEARSGDFIYLDPPYSATTRFRGEYGYDTAFRDEHIEPLISVCKELDEKGAHVMLSYKLNDVVSSQLRDWNVKQLTVPRSVGGKAQSRTMAPELLVMNY